MLRSIGKQSGKSGGVSPEEEKEDYGGICRKRRFSAWNERVSG